MDHRLKQLKKAMNESLHLEFHEELKEKVYQQTTRGARNKGMISKVKDSFLTAFSVVAFAAALLLTTAYVLDYIPNPSEENRIGLGHEQQPNTGFGDSDDLRPAEKRIELSLEGNQVTEIFQLVTLKDGYTMYLMNGYKLEEQDGVITIKKKENENIYATLEWPAPTIWEQSDAEINDMIMSRMGVSDDKNIQPSNTIGMGDIWGESRWLVDMSEKQNASGILTKTPQPLLLVMRMPFGVGEYDAFIFMAESLDIFPPSKHKIVIEKRIEQENKYEVLLEKRDYEAVRSIQTFLDQLKWENAKVLMEGEPDYILNGRYALWITSKGQISMVILDENKYVKLGAEESMQLIQLLGIE